MFVRRLAVALASLGILAGCSGGGGVQTGLRVEILATPESGAYPLEVSLKANVDGQPAPDEAEYEWDLGDGASSTDANPIHVFTDIGSYTVKVKIKAKGKKGAASHDIEVLEVGPGTDIAVESVEAAPSQVNPGSPVNVKVTLRNRGTVGTDTAFINRVFITTTETEDEFDPLLEQQAGTINMSGGIAGDTSIDKELNITLDEQDFAANQYWIWVVSDATDNVDEVNESNNIARSTTKLTITDSTLPVNITVTEPTLSGTTFTPGAPVTVNTTLSNTGTAEAGAFTVKVFLSPDPTIDANDTAVYTHSVSSMAGGATDPLALMVDVPAMIANRPWYLGVIADPGGELAETDETDNAADYSAGLVTTTGSSGCTEDANEPNDSEAEATVLVPGSMPNFTVCGATADWFKIDLGAGDRLSSSIAFQNVNGNLDLAVFRMGDSTPLATSTTSGNSESVNSGYATSAGTYLVRVTLSGAGGNTYDLTSAIEDNGGAGIDLVPTALTFGTGNGPFAQGVAHQTSLTLYNFGAMNTTTSFNVALWLSVDQTVDGGDTALGSSSIASLAAGTSTNDARSVTIPAGVADGYYYVIAVADTGNSNTETVESNNVFTKLIPVADGCLDDTFEPNETIALATPIDNGTFPMLQICTPLEANGDIYAVTTGAGGTIQASIVIDGTGSGTSDLDMRLVGSNGSAPSGCTDCSAASSSPNEDVSFTSTTGGTYYVKVFGYFSNSAAPYTLTISGSTGSIADFTPNGVVAGPTAVLAGDDVQVDGKIKNNSTQMTPDFEWSIRLSTDATIDGGDMTMATVAETALAANENRVISKKVTLPESLAGGNYWLGVVADPAGMVTEGSESNNIAVAGPVAVTALCNDDGYEENDTPGSAAAIAIGGTISSLYVCPNDADFFSVTPASAGTLTIHADFVHSANGDIDMRLYQGTALLLSSTSVNDDEDISYAVQGGVTYRIKVYGFSTTTNPFNGNSYTLTTTLSP